MCMNITPIQLDKICDAIKKSITVIFSSMLYSDNIIYFDDCKCQFLSDSCWEISVSNFLFNMPVDKSAPVERLRLFTGRLCFNGLFKSGETSWRRSSEITQGKWNWLMSHLSPSAEFLPVLKSPFSMRCKLNPAFCFISINLVMSIIVIIVNYADPMRALRNLLTND